MDESVIGSARVLLDLVSVANAESSDDEGELAVATAFGRLTEIGAITIGAESVETGDDENDELEVTVDLTPLLSGTSLTLTWLLSELADARGVELEQVLFDVRAFVERAAAEGVE